MGPETPRSLGPGQLLHRHGFTVLELLVALAVSAVVVLGVRAALSVSMDVAARGRDVTDEALRVEAARNTIRRWLESAYIGAGLQGWGFDGRDQMVAGEPRDVLAFVTVDPVLLDSRQGSAFWIRLRVAATDSGLVADFGIVEPGDWTNDTETRRIQILPQVRAMDIRYQVTLGSEFRWFSGWSSRVRLPRAVELRFDTEPEDSVAPELELPLLVTLARQG